MYFIAVDDDPVDLNCLERAIIKASPGSEITCFSKSRDAILYAKKNRVDVAFLDIKITGINGLALAKRLRNIKTDTNIVFVTEHCRYALSSYSVSASDYILKPVTAEAISRALNHLRNPLAIKKDKAIRVQTFGNFEVFFEGRPLKFTHKKTKELLAYLIDNKGAVVNVNEICMTLWENGGNEYSNKSHLRRLVGDLLKTLQEVGQDSVIYKQRNGLAIVTEKVDCDYYGLLKLDSDSIKAYSGEYMSQYSWAEYRTGQLDKLKSPVI